MIVKRIIFTLGIALLFTLQAAAQCGKTAPKQCGCDTVLLSQTRNGDYIVSKYLVKDKTGKDASFSVYYAINLSNIAKSFLRQLGATLRYGLFYRQFVRFADAYFVRFCRGLFVAGR